MHRKNIGVLHEMRRCESNWSRRIVKAVVERHPELIERETGTDPLAKHREVFVHGRKIGPEVFAADGPMRRERGLDADAGRPAEAVEEAVFGIAGRVLCQCLLIVGPGEDAGGIEQPVAGSIADTAAKRARRQHVFAEASGPEGRRRQIRNATDRHTRDGVGKSRKRSVALDTQYHAIPEHPVIAALHAFKPATAFLESIGRMIKPEGASYRRAAAGRRDRPALASRRKANMAADIKTGPVIVGGRGRGFDRKIGGPRRAAKQRDYGTE